MGMGRLFSRKPRPDGQPHPLGERKPTTILAASVDISTAGAKAWAVRHSDDAWQREVWYHYDACGEFRFSTNWIANAMSKAVMQALEVDAATGLEGGPTENTTVRGIANSILGGPAARSQAQATMGLNLQVPAEYFILVIPQPAVRGIPQPDRWHVMSTTEISEKRGVFSYCDPYTGTEIPLRQGVDMVIRTWIPHPRLQSHADSAARACVPSLREIEKSSQAIAARLDSRLASNGLLLMPQEVEFPKGDTDATGAAAVMDYLMKAMTASMKSPGEASAQVPIVAMIPGEMIQYVKWLTFTTELDQSLLDLRKDAIGRLAIGLDMPPEIMLGLGESNHWSAWQIEEAAYKIHIAPLLDRLADAITTHWFHPALRLAGITDPERYIIGFDVTDILSRPDNFTNMTELWDRVLISDEAMREAAGVPESAAPTDEEKSTRFFKELVEKAPTLITVPAIARALGVDVEQAAAATVGDAPADAAPALPAGDGNRATPATQGDQPPGSPDTGLVAAAELVIFDALSRAGGRLLTREHRGQHQDVAKFELHTVIPDAGADVERLLEGSFQFVDTIAAAFAVDAEELVTRLRIYSEHLLTHAQAHDRDLLRSQLWHL